MLQKGDKGVNVAARPPESGPAEAECRSALNLPLISIPHPARMPDGPAKAREVSFNCEYLQSMFTSHIYLM